MAHDGSQHHGDEPSPADESPHDSPSPITITTTDPVIETVVEHPSDWKIHPDTTVYVETTQMCEPGPLYVAGVRTVVFEDRLPRHGVRPDDAGRSNGGAGSRSEQGRGPGRQVDQDRGGRDRDQGNGTEGQDGGQGRGKEQSPLQSREQDRDDRQDRPVEHQQPSMMRTLLVTAGVALLCGVIGAMGYSYFFGSKTDNSSSEQSESKKDSSSKKKSSGGSNEESGKESNSQTSTSSSTPGFSSAEDADTLKKQIMDLMQQVDRLGERVDRMTRPKDETPPVLHTLQIKVGELAREMDELAALPAKVRHYDNRLETLQEEIKNFRARIESMQNSSTPTAAAGLDLPPRTGAISSGAGSLGDNPTMELGISLLERGQFASAREIFQRLQLASPNDARVWYLSALAEGLTSGDWDGQAKRLAERGLERERRNAIDRTDRRRAGHPHSDQRRELDCLSPPKGPERQRRRQMTGIAPELTTVGSLRRARIWGIPDSTFRICGWRRSRDVESCLLNLESRIPLRLHRSLARFSDRMLSVPCAQLRD